MTKQQPQNARVVCIVTMNYCKILNWCLLANFWETLRQEIEDRYSVWHRIPKIRIVKIGKVQILEKRRIIETEINQRLNNRKYAKKTINAKLNPLMLITINYKH